MSVSLPGSSELKEVVRESQRLARDAGQRWNTLHILLALWVPERNRASEVLGHAGVELDRLLGVMERFGKAEEAPRLLSAVFEKSREMARTSGYPAVGTLHLLAALCRFRGAVANRMLLATGADALRVRAAALRQLNAERPDTGELRVLRAPSDGEERRDSPRQEAPVSRPAPALVPPPEPDAVATPALPAAPAAEATARRPARIIDAPPRDDVPDSPWALSEDEFPTLCRLGRNLSVLAAEGTLDPAIGRTTEVGELLDVLLKRRANNPLLIGEPGVGKTAIVEGLANRLAALPEGDPLRGRVLVEVPISALDAGTHLRGSFTRRMQELMDEVREADGRVVVFFDEIHTLIGAGAGDGNLDAGNVLKTALARGEFPCIGATTDEEYTRTIARDPALTRRFTLVQIDEPDVETATAMIEGVLDRYEAHHGVVYAEGVAKAAVRLSHRYLPADRLPAKAINLADEAASRARRGRRQQVTHKDLAQVISEKTRIPVAKILTSDQQRLLEMDDHLTARIVGHEAQLRRLCNVLRRNFAGFRSRRPIGSYLLLGPTGVGKTETARVIAEYFFDSPDALRQFNMSEYGDAASVNKLIGAPAGYEGHDELPALTRAVGRQSHQVLLFDEIEKSHPSLWKIFLQMLEEGTVEDRRGVRLDFRECIVIMTSNLGAEVFSEAPRSIGFAGATGGGGEAARRQTTRRVLDAARAALPPELFARFDEALVFGPLGARELATVATLLVAQHSAALQAERGVALELTEEAVEAVLAAARAADNREGARAVRRVIAEQVIDVAARHMLGHAVPAPSTLVIGVEEERLAVTGVRPG